MGSKWPKIFRDPIHDMVSFEDDPTDELLLELIDTKEFQRLRRFKQLGMADLVFPGANHSRFAHSIGVVHVAKMFLDRIGYSRTAVGEKAEARKVVLVAALLHDVGHGPFSHTSENVISNDSHEKWTRKIIMDDSTEVHSVLAKHDPDLPDKLEQFFLGAFKPNFLTLIVMSQLDADRCDYLLRDSHATGTNYGNFDISWLIHHIFLDEGNKRFYLSRKALSAAEAYVYARYHMYRTVYYHKAIRAADLMFQHLCRRYKELLEGASLDGAKRAAVPEAPNAVFAAFSKTITLGEYLQLDDHIMTHFFEACAGAKDEIVSFLGNGLVNRKLYKCIDVTDAFWTQLSDFSEELEGWLHEHGHKSPYDWTTDDPGDLPYRPYRPQKDKPAQVIFVEDSMGNVREIAEVTKRIEPLTKPYTLARYYFRRDQLRQEAKSIATRHFGRS